MIPQFEPSMSPQYADTVAKQINSGWVGVGITTTKFERKFAKYVGSKYAIATTSGTVALLIALSSLNLDKNVIIALPNYSFIAATNVIRYNKNNFQLYDINKKTLSLDIKEFKKNPTKCIIYINHNGYVGKDLEDLSEYCKKNKIKFIEDSACALGQRYNGKHAGTFGDIGCFSFSVPKILTTGQGGMIVTNDKLLRDRCKEIIDQGSLTWRKDGYHLNTGLNFKFNDILASLGLIQLNKINQLLEKRATIQKRFIDYGLDLHSYKTDNDTGTWMNILLNVNTKKIMMKLKERGIQSKMYYKPINKSINLMGYYPNTEYIYSHSLYLPSSLTLTEDQIDHICDIVGENL